MKFITVLCFVGLLGSLSIGGRADPIPEWTHNDIEEWNNLLILPNSVCGLGQVQSPLDFNTSIQWPASDESLVINYPATIEGLVSNNKHGSPQINFPEGGAYVTLDGDRFNLLQVHFHSPSEETFDGVAPALDAHLVHQNPDTKQLLVIGITFNEGEESNQLLDIAVDNDPTAESDKKNSVQGVPLAAFIPNAEMYTFNGSLTTPPCSEGVKWFVSQKIMSATKAEIEGLKSVAESQGLENGNARPTQPLNGRPVNTIKAQMASPGSSAASGTMASGATTSAVVSSVALAGLTLVALA